MTGPAPRFHYVVGRRESIDDLRHLINSASSRTPPTPLHGHSGAN